MITKKTKIFGIVSLLFFLGSVGGVLVVWQYVKSEGKELLYQKSEIADFEAREQTYKELESTVASTQLDREELNTYILTEEGTIDFLATVEQVAIEQGVELTTDSLQVKEEKGLFDTLVISYSVEGAKKHVEAMLLLLETLPYHAFVSDLSLQFSSKEGFENTRGSVELSISLLKYDR